MIKAGVEVKDTEKIIIPAILIHSRNISRGDLQLSCPPNLLIVSITLICTLHAHCSRRGLR